MNQNWISKKTIFIVLGLVSINQKIHSSEWIKKNPIKTTTIVSAIAYGAYQQMQQAAPESIPLAKKNSIQAIIFDIDGVLTKTNKLRAFYEIDINNQLSGALNKPVSLRYMAQHRKLPSEKILFDTLSSVPATSPYKSYNKGLPMPQIMIDWQTNAQNPLNIEQTITEHLHESDLPHAQKQWALESVKLMLNPKKFIATRQEIIENIMILEELKKQGYKLYILSNWDAQSFPLFQERFSNIFVTQDNQPMFDGIMISGHEGIVKPETALFKQCLKKFKLNPEKTVFIDDEPANIHAAQELKIKTVHADPNNPNNVRSQLLIHLKSNS